jgi:hypothetical protein
MRTANYEKIKKKLKKSPKLVDIEKGKDEAPEEEEEDLFNLEPGDISLIKTILLLFIGGACIAGSIYYLLVSFVGGLPAPPEEAPPKEEPPAPTEVNRKPGHWVWWKALDVYDGAAGKLGGLVDRGKAAVAGAHSIDDGPDEPEQEEADEDKKSADDKSGADEKDAVEPESTTTSKKTDKKGKKDKLKKAKKELEVAKDKIDDLKAAIKPKQLKTEELKLETDGMQAGN